MNARLAELLTEDPVEVGAYVDMLGDLEQAGPSTGVTQRLMHTSAVAMVYERYWRPALGAIAKGFNGPSMAQEHAFAVDNLALQPDHLVLDVACGTGGFTRTFADAVGPTGLTIGLDASRTIAGAWFHRRTAALRGRHSAGGGPQGLMEALPGVGVEGQLWARDVLGVA